MHVVFYAGLTAFLIGLLILLCSAFTEDGDLDVHSWGTGLCWGGGILAFIAWVMMQVPVD